MNRHHGSRLRADRSLLALAAALLVFAVSALAMLVTQTAAHADTVTVSISNTSMSQSGTIYDEQPFAFYLADSPSVAGLHAGVTICGTDLPTKPPTCGGLTGQSIGYHHFSSSVTLPVGSYTVKWEYVGKFYYSTVNVQSVPPPPTSTPPTTPASTDPGSSTTAPGSTPPGSGSSTPSGTSTGSGSSSPGSTPSTSGGGGITIGPGGTITSQDVLPIGFGAPPSDPNNPTPSIPNPIGSGVGVVPSGGLTTATPSDSSSTQTLVELANSTPKSKSRPTTLAIVSIGVLAIVASLYAYRRLGEQALRPGH